MYLAKKPGSYHVRSLVNFNLKHMILSLPMVFVVESGSGFEASATEAKLVYRSNRAHPAGCTERFVWSAGKIVP